MRLMAMEMLAFGLTTCFMCRAMYRVESAPCPLGTVAIAINTRADVNNLTDALHCVGQGIFNVTWHSSVMINEMIEVSDNKNVTVTGAGLHSVPGAPGNDNDAGVIIDAGSDTGIFSVSGGSTLRLNNIGLEGGSAEDGGAVSVLSSSVLYVFGCTFTRNKASNGGALFASKSSIYVDGNTSLEDNSALYGGAIYADESDIYIDGHTSFGNNSAEGSNVEIVSSSDFGSYSEFTLSTLATSSGGAIFANSSVANIDGDTSFTDNFAVFQGGAIYAEQSAIRVHGKSCFSNNVAQGAVTTSVRRFYNTSDPGAKGGAIGAIASMVYIGNDTSWAYNFADLGGAIFALESEISIDAKSSFTNNSAGDEGGAVFAEFSKVSLNGNTLFSSNRAADRGGAICALSSELDIDGNARLTNNSAGDHGGAIFAKKSDINIDANASFTENSVGRNGAGVHADGLSKVSLNAKTQFSGNSALGFGGGLYVGTSEARIYGNATFTRNSASSGGAVWVGSISNITFDGNAIFTANSALRSGGAIYGQITSDIVIAGNAMFAHNWAGEDGGGIAVATDCNVTITGRKTLGGELSDNERGLNSEAGVYFNSDWSIVFVNNSAVSLGGAILLSRSDQVQVSNVKFKSNQASLGGAVYILAVDDEQTFFSECVLEGNTAEDGGAVYLHTGPGVDIFTASVFRSNFAEVSGGAIFHTGSMRVSNTTFVANKAAAEGPAIMSVGFLEELSNVSFVENAFYCRVGEYGYIDKNEANATQDDFCRTCFEEVCSRCSAVRNIAIIREDVRIDGKPVCERPPLGATANSAGTTVASLALQKGHFRTSNKSRIILPCYQNNACQGGKAADEYCSDGYKGPYCAVCDTGFAPGVAYSCRECSGNVTRSAVGLAVAVGLALIIFAGLLISHLGSAVRDGAEESINRNQSLWKNKCRSCQASLVNMLPVRAIKIVVTVWQIVSQFDAIAGDIYPDLYQNFVSKLNPINLDLDFFFSYSCLVSNDFYDHLVFATITPLVALVVLAGSCYIGMKRNNASESAMREVRHKHQAAVLFIAFLVYSPVSYRILQTFGCDELDDGETYLRADYSLSCLTARHNWYKVYASFMVAVYPIGITAAFAGLLVWHRQDLVKPDRGTLSHLKPFKGVWAAYKPSRYYYEVVECGRRIALTAIAAFVLPNSTSQISMALLFAVTYVFVSEVLSPFRKGIDMGLYRWGNGIVVASMYVAFLKKIDFEEDTASEEYLLTFSGVLIAANIFMVVTVLVQTALLAKEMHANKNAVRVRPVRRTHSMSLGALSPVQEGKE